MELILNEAILRLVLAAVLASVIGLERELNHQSAGLRTHILVCLGATVFTLVSLGDMTRGLYIASGAVNSQVNINHDPGRIAAQVVTGIGFIGGGAVLRHGNSIRGITTAASLWMIASVGMLCGVGQYYLAGISTFIAFMVLFTIGSLERNFLKKELRKYTRMRLHLTVRHDAQRHVQLWIERKFGTDVLETKSSRDDEKQSVILTYTVNLNGNTVDVNKLSQQLNGQHGMMGCNIRVYQEEGDD
ncbi:MAG: MgtC/SapB family protein [Vampirovibrionales bacterium]|nr:MgtC/SapB family protein [Vampirovibrionales bacterium]